MSDKRRDYDARLLQALLADARHNMHGTTGGHRAGCRCTPCREHATARVRAWRNRT